jgi:hypothetical protein
MQPDKAGKTRQGIDVVKARTARVRVFIWGLQKANPKKTTSAHSESPGYFPKSSENTDGNLREASPKPMTATLVIAIHNLLRLISPKFIKADS